MPMPPCSQPNEHVCPTSSRNGGPRLHGPPPDLCDVVLNACQVRCSGPRHRVHASLLVAGRTLPGGVRRLLLSAAEFEQVCRAAGAQPQPACESYSGRGLSHEMPPSKHDRPCSGQTLYTRARRATGVEAQASSRRASKHAARRTSRHAVARSARTQNIPEPIGLPSGRVAHPATQTCSDPARQMIHTWRSTRRRTRSIRRARLAPSTMPLQLGVLPVSLCMDRRCSPAAPAAHVALGAAPALGHAAGPSRPASKHGRLQVRPPSHHLLHDWSPLCNPPFAPWRCIPLSAGAWPGVPQFSCLALATPLG